MSTGVRKALPRMHTSVEMFSHVTICMDGESRTVQVIHRWWLYEDGSYSLSLHRADNPLCGSALVGCDAGGRHVLETRAAAMWQLGQKVPV